MAKDSETPILMENLKREHSFVELLLRITLGANMSSHFDEVMRTCLKEICLFMKWPVGHFYLVTSNKPPIVLSPTRLWYLEDEKKFESFVSVTESTKFQPGEGLPGEVLASGKPQWIRDLHSAPNFPRARKARDLNLKSGFAFPITAKNVVTGVMEFFSMETSQPDQRILEVMSNIGVQVGQAYQRAQMEEELKIRNRAVEQSLSPVMITDPRGVIEYVNPAFSHHTGYTFEEAVGKRPSILKSGQHTPDFYEHLWKTILSGAEWKKEMCNRRKDGSLCWELQSISPIVDDQGKICNFISLKLDDTRRRETAEKLKEYASELERSNRELQDFATIASHDLREPLRKIITFGERLKITLTNLDQQSSDYLHRMHKSALKMDEFLQGLLKYSQISRKPHAFEAVDLNQLTHEVLEDLELKITQSRAAIKLDKLPTLEADPMQMRQLFANLIGNAIKFHREGVPPVIGVNGFQEIDGRWRIVVEDNGIGFDEHYVERIFKPFERLHGHNVYEGNGIGLAICKKITDRHKGEITAHSKPGIGSAFTILLPAKQGGNCESRMKVEG